jgi:hypothetical protein
MGEHITIQLGNYANYVGTHFWNYQDELYLRLNNVDESNASEDDKIDTSLPYDFMQIYRQNRTQSGQTICTPRLLVVDKKEHMSAYNPNSELFHSNTGRTEAIDVNVTWSGSVSTLAKAKETKSSFQIMLENEQKEL